MFSREAKGSWPICLECNLLHKTSSTQDGKQYGDEYLAELDFIEVVERQKEGYESDVRDPESEDDTNVPASLVGEDDDEDEDFHSNSAGDGVSSSDRQVLQREWGDRISDWDEIKVI